MISNDLKRARGTDQPCRMSTNPTSFPPITDETMPDMLDEAGLKEWKRLVPVLKERGMATVMDYVPLQILCSIISKLKFIHSQITNENMLVQKNQTAGINFVVNPYIKLYDSYFDKLMKLSAKFGLTPADRTRIGMPTKIDTKERNDLIRRAN